MFLYQVDVRTRDNPGISIEGGVIGGSYREVLATITHPDAANGERDISHMTIWGDVDPNFHPLIATLEANSAVMPWTPSIPIVLSAGAGTKTINTRVYFQSNRSVTASTTYVLAVDIPHVTILRLPKREFLSSLTSVVVAWSCSHAVTAWTVCIAPTYDAPRTACAPIVSGGAASAGAMVESTFSYAQALAAVPDTAGADDLTPLSITGRSFVKVFCTTALGVTS